MSDYISKKDQKQFREMQNISLSNFMNTYDATPEQLSFPGIGAEVSSLGDAGVKHDTGKPDYTLLTKEFKDGVTAALEYGKGKYGRNNYKKGMEWLRVAAACERHLTAWANREEQDKESGLSHLAHAGACIAMLLYYESKKVGTDNRD